MLADLSTVWLFLAFAAAGAVILVVSIRMTALADVIADRAGWGEAIVGGVVLGAATSLSGLVVSVSSAWTGDASLAFSNGVGGIAAQTAFLAVADLTYRKVNLEHAAAEVANIFQGITLVTLLTLPLVAWSAPPVTVLGLHPVSALMVATYAYALKLTAEVRARPMWTPVQTEDTRADEPEDASEADRSPWGPALAFAGLAVLLAASGWVVAQATSETIARFGISSTLGGALMSAVVTSLPELVTTIAAVRRGALQLAVGGIIGGNTFDTLFLAASDGAYREGSLFHALQDGDFFWLSVGILMTAVLLAGQVRREKRGPAGIGFESVALVAIYGGAVAWQAISG
ncbi:sodium:calcium antiporter [Jannaschia sp. Os4]|uniref:sodium:calcium antiporter n=1 Tax=Jannaschia sp. Os4 TaxID=2807617 RepID=UPI00193AA650|nr:sodium:calcium antiporter [Jannaschia sp. Os4]MBM2574776.1 sodium:calcium antiporter [Jannaschia sp. Os4]